MRIEEDLKLDYNSVLIRPKRSTLGSRKEVDLYREYTFRNAQLDGGEPHYNGVPVMASNMDGVGTFEIADALCGQGLFTCLVKNYSIESLKQFFLGSAKCILAIKVHFLTAAQSAALGANQYAVVVQLQVFFNSHYSMVFCWLRV